MKRDDIRKLADLAGWTPTQLEMASDAEWARLERFAALVAAAEREACAKLCDEIGSDLWIGDADEASVAKCAAAIRARSTP